jgi:alpha,alpha-trehalose phosphorylase
MRDHNGRITFAPRLPPALTRLRFRMMLKGRTLEVAVSRSDDGSDPGESATYRLLAGAPFDTSHHGKPLRLSADEPVTLPVPPAPQVAPVTQPRGRRPRHRA